MNRPAAWIRRPPTAVIDIFEDLVQQGRTILLVTHDKDIAKRGSRIITLSDGEIVGLDAALSAEVPQAERGGEGVSKGKDGTNA